MSQIYRKSQQPVKMEEAPHTCNTLEKLCSPHNAGLCEIPEVIGVRISKKGVVVCPVLQFWISEGCPGLNPQFGEDVNMAVYWPC